MAKTTSGPQLASAAPTGNDVADFTKDWKRLQAQKWRMRGGVEARMILNLAHRFGEQYIQQARDAIYARPMDKDEAKNRLRLVFNLIKKQRNRKIGHLFRIGNEFRITPSTNDPAALDTSDVVNRARKCLDRKLKERLQHWRRLSWMVDTGVVIEHTPWIEEATAEPIPAYDDSTGQLLWRDAQNPDPNAILTQSQVMQACQMGASPERFTVVMHTILTGEVGSQIVSGLNFFIDASVPTISELGHDQACYIAEVKTLGFIGETFGQEAEAKVQASINKDLSIVRSRLLDRGGSAVANMNIRDILPAITGSALPDDPPMTIVLTRYQPGCRDYPNGRRSILTPYGVMLEDGETPYGEIPCTDFHYEAPTTSFWTGDFITDLIPPQKFLNKRMSQLGEAANAQLYEMLLLGGELTAADLPSDIHGVVEDGINEDGSPRVVPLQHAQLPSFFLDSIKLVVEQLMTIGAVDMMDHKQMPGQIRGPMVLPLFQEMVDSEDAPLYMHLAEQLAAVHQQRINRMKQFYPPIRTMQATGPGKRDEVLVFHTQDILRSGITYTVSYDPGSIYPEFSALREARIIERLASPLAGLYADRRTGRIDYTKLAYELRFSDADDTDRQSQYRTLAKHLIGRLYKGEPLSQTLPEAPYPFWDHGTVLDELESAMATTEWMESSVAVRQEFMGFYEKARQYLAAIQQSMEQAAQSQMMQSAVAQAAQFTAAKVAADTAAASESQLRISEAMAGRMGPATVVAANAADQQARGARPPMAPGPTGVQ